MNKDLHTFKMSHAINRVEQLQNILIMPKYLGFPKNRYVW